MDEFCAQRKYVEDERKCGTRQSEIVEEYYGKNLTIEIDRKFNGFIGKKKKRRDN